MNEYGTFPMVDPSDELTVVETAYGPIEKWRARALAIGWMSAMTHRADDSDKHTTPQHDEDKPPRLAADEIKAVFDDLIARDRRIRDIQDMIRRCDSIEARLDALAKREPARQALLAAEAEFTERDDAAHATRH